MSQPKAIYATRHADPAFVRDEALQSVKDHIEDIYSHLPPEGAHTTAQTLTDARAAYKRLGGAIERLSEAQERVDAGAARRGFEWEWERA
jgi:hypothetical protein